MDHKRKLIWRIGDRLDLGSNDLETRLLYIQRLPSQPMHKGVRLGEIDEPFDRGSAPIMRAEQPSAKSVTGMFGIPLSSMLWISVLISEDVTYPFKSIRE
jgi:hypothetical protein